MLTGRQLPLAKLGLAQMAGGRGCFAASRVSVLAFRTYQGSRAFGLSRVWRGAQKQAKAAKNSPSDVIQGPLIPKAQLLALARSPLQRLWVHVKWPLTRNNRPFLLDDFSAFASWLVMGNILWIILGTTTFGLVFMYLIDAVDKFWSSFNGKGEDDSPLEPVQSPLGSLAGRILSHGLGARIVFEKGNVLPQLEDGMLKFQNVHLLLSANESEKAGQTQFSAKISKLNLSLSFKKWYEGNGLIRDMEIFGMHAKVIRNEGAHLEPAIQDSGSKNAITFNSLAMSFSKYNHDSQELGADFDEHKFSELSVANGVAKSSLLDSEYEFEHVKIHDSFIELYESEKLKAFKVSIFNCDLPRLRGDRILVDFFNANNVTGAINNSMFTIHKHQTFAESGKVIRFKLDGIDMGSLSSANQQLKLNWLVNGKAEIIADIRLPDLDKVEAGSAESTQPGVIQQMMDELLHLTYPRQPPATDLGGGIKEEGLLKGAMIAIYETFRKQAASESEASGSDYVIVNAKVKFTDLQASLPAYLPMSSSTVVPFTTLQNLRSLIAYINNREGGQPLVIKTTVIEKLLDLRNMDNISQTRIFDAIVSDIYEEMMRMIKMDEKRIMEEKSSMWSHSVMSQLLLLGLGVLA